jgi:ribokinase
MFDVITFGSATRDIFVRSKEFKIIDFPEFVTGKALAVEAGSKLKINELIFCSGGGGTNTAATFARQFLKTAYVGLVGDDAGGREVVRELDGLGVKTEFLKVTSKAQTPYSIILSSPGEPARHASQGDAGGERSILVFEGASHLLSPDDIPWESINNTKWFYVAGLSGESANAFRPIVEFAAEKGIKLAVNPSGSQLKHGLENLKRLLDKIDIFIVNQEEASLVTGVDYQNENELFKKFDELIPGIAVMSKGPQGVAVSDGQKIYRAGIPESDYVDRTGSGDAFGSGFVATIIGGGSIEAAIQFGTANATSTIQQIGAKNGLLPKNEWGPWEKVEVEIENF